MPDSPVADASPTSGAGAPAAQPLVVAVPKGRILDELRPLLALPEPVAAGGVA